MSRLNSYNYHLLSSYFFTGRQWGLERSQAYESKKFVEFPIIAPNSVLTILMIHSDETETDSSNVAAVGIRNNAGFWINKSVSDGTFDGYWLALVR